MEKAQQAKFILSSQLQLEKRCTHIFCVQVLWDGSGTAGLLSPVLLCSLFTPPDYAQRFSMPSLSSFSRVDMKTIFLCLLCHQISAHQSSLSQVRVLLLIGSALVPSTAVAPWC